MSFQFWRNEFAGRRGLDHPGVDPYNTADAIKVQNAELISAMGKAWKGCVAAMNDPPDVIWAGSWFGDALYQHLATPDRGHEFLPYG